MNILEFAEPVLICLALIFFLKSGMSKRFPAMRTYLALRAGSAVVLEIILNPASYSFMAQAGWQGSQFTEEAILQKALVTGPGVRP